MVNQKLIDYIKENLSKGYTEQPLRENLVKNGYSEKEINESFNFLNSQNKDITNENKDKQEEIVKPKKKIDIFAILSIIFGLLFFIPFAYVLGLIFGIISIVRIKKNNNLKGTWLAVIGIILSLIFLIFTIFLGIMLSPLIKDINKGIEEYQAAEKELGDKWVLKVYDLEDDTTITLSTDFSEKHHPEIYKNVVVWEDLRNGNYDIYLYNLDTKEEKQITTNEKHQKNPQIFNDKIVWQDCRNSQTIGDTCKEADIYMYDLSSDSEIAVSSTKGNQMSPKIYGNYVLWSNHLSNSLLAAGSLHLELPLEIYDIAQGKISRVELPEDMVKAYSPEIYQNKIVYYAKNDSLLSDYRMFLYDIDEKTTEEFQFDGGFWGGGKIFEDNYVLVERSENWREEKKLTISLLDLNTKQKEELLEIEYTPSIDIFEDKIIYLTKIKGTTYKIHIYDSNQKKDIKIIDEFTDFYGPGFYDNKIAYISRES